MGCWLVDLAQVRACEPPGGQRAGLATAAMCGATSRARRPLKPKPRWDLHTMQIAGVRVSPWLWFSSSGQGDERSRYGPIGYGAVDCAQSKPQERGCQMGPSSTDRT